MARISADLLARYDRPGPRYTSYPTVPAWSLPFGEAEYRQALAAVGPDATVSLYLHLPFCTTRCHYCGCNAVATHRHDVIEAYLDRLEDELDLVVAALGRGRRVVQMHWGGGTPNVLDGAQCERLVARLHRDFAFAPGAEQSIELDPRAVTPGQIARLRRLGFTRVSLGVQDIDPDVQAAIGRPQPLTLVRRVVDEVRTAEFDSLNLDLIYGLPRQDPARFGRTIAAAIGLAPDRVAVFGYAHVPGLRSHQKRIDEATLPTGEGRFRLFEDAVAAFEDAGYRWIGLDHFARADDELSRALDAQRLHRNFMGYTVLPADHLIGLGMSSIGDVAGRFIQLDAKLGRYMHRVEAGELPVHRGHVLSDDDRRRRHAIMHLMCNLELPRHLALDGGGTPETMLTDSLDRLELHADEGLVALEPGRIVVTPTGRYFLRNLCMELDAYLGEATAGATFSRTV